MSIGEWHGQEDLTVVTMDDFDVVRGREFLDKGEGCFGSLYQHYLHPWVQGLHTSDEASLQAKCNTTLHFHFYVFLFSLLSEGVRVKLT